MTATQTDIAEQKIARFVGRFDESYRLLAYYAALPLVLTPELLNYLRNHFLRGQVPWVAEADLLLSELCRPVGYEQFAMVPDVRDYLLGEMRERLGEAKMREVARLLIRYVHQLNRTNAPFSQEELKAERWSAMVYLKERCGEAAQEIAESFRDRLMGDMGHQLAAMKLISPAELECLVRVTGELSSQLQDYPALLHYAADVALLLASPAKLMMLEASRRTGKMTSTVQVAGVVLPDVGSLVNPSPVEISEEAVEVSPAVASESLKEPSEPIADLRDKLQDGSLGPKMVWLPGGKFRMGDENGYEREKPVHEVAVSAFPIGQYLVTFEEYDRFCEATRREKPNDYNWGRGTRPVIGISREDARAYCEWLSQQTGERYRLPTEAEWEYACRAASATRYCYGDDEQHLGEYAWYSRNSEGKTHPVGGRLPNAWQLYDMHGNVWEWVRDWYANDYYKRSPRENPSGPESGAYRVIRGGSWGYVAVYCRSACRSYWRPAYRRGNLGFRLARTGAWPLDALTLGQRPVEESSVSPPSEPKPRYQPYQGFQDRFDRYPI